MTGNTGTSCGGPGPFGVPAQFAAKRRKCVRSAALTRDSAPFPVVGRRRRDLGFKKTFPTRPRRAPERRNIQPVPKSLKCGFKALWMFLPRNCSTKSSIFAPPGVKLEFGIKWSRSHPHFCASENHKKSRVTYLARAAPGIHQSCESHISHARFVVPIVSCDPSESRV